MAAAATILVTLVATFLAAALLWPQADAHGSAGWSKPTTDTVKSARAKLPSGSFILSEEQGKRVVLSRLEAMRHGVIVGGSGTGKSRGYFLPNAALANDTSLVCTDPKGELWNLTSGFHPKALRYAPTEPDASECFNWIPLCSDARIAELCARAIVESGQTEKTEQAWIDTETAFLAGVFAHASTLSEPTPLTAYRLFTRQTVESLIQTLLNSPSEAAREQGMVFSQTQERMRGSIVPVVAAKLQFLRDPAVMRFTSASLDPARLGSLRTTPTAVYWCLQEHDIVRLRPLTSLFFSLLLEQLAAEPVKENHAIPVRMLLDEFANIGKIPNFASTLSLARGRGLSIWLCIQSLGQLESEYGKAHARTIVSNCSTKVALSGLDVESAEYFSRALGERTFRKRRLSLHSKTPVSLTGSYTSTKAEHARALLTPDEVRRIREDQAIVIVGNRRPMLLAKNYYSKPAFTAHTSPLPFARAETIVERRKEPPPLPVELLQYGARPRRAAGSSRRAGHLRRA